MTGNWGALRRDRSFWALLVVLGLSVPILLHAGRDQWFALDEWDFLLDRELTDPGSLLDAWFGHWVTLPAVIYRTVYRVFGVSSYLPYQALAIAGHFSVVLAVWALARRMEVRGWVAVTTVVPLVLLGEGRMNILFGFQITMTLALSLSLLHLLLADRDGPWSRRDTLGLACGVAALMCSGVGIVGAIGVGAATLLRRGWRIALAHAAPLVAMWLVWRASVPNRGFDSTTAIDRETVDFLLAMPKVALGGLARLEPVAWAIGGLAALGVVALVRSALRQPRPTARRRLSPLVGVVVTLLAFMAAVASQRLPRADLREPGESRYVYVVVALVLPLVALGVEALVRRRTAFGVLACLLLALGVPANVRLLDDRFLVSAHRDVVVALANSELLESAPQRDVVGLLGTDDLRRIAALRGLPDADGISTDVRLHADLLLGLRMGTPTDRASCRTLSQVRRHLEPGEVLEVRGTVDLVLVDGADRSRPFRVDDAFGGAFTVSRPMDLEATGVRYTGRPPGIYVCPSG